MRSTLQSEEPFASAYQNLKSAIESRAIGLEDTEQLYRLVKPLESALAEMAEIPSGESAADKIARLLWFKGHIVHFDVPFVLRSMRENDPLVRTIAIATLRGFVDEHEAPADQRLLLQAQRTVNDQSRIESSPLLSYMLSQLTTELHKQISRPSHQARRPPPNPFIAGLPIRNEKLFFGRQRLLREIEESFREGVKGLLLFGARRTGKTSLLLRIQRGALGDGFAAVFIDVQSAAGKSALVPLVLRALAEQWPNLIDQLGHATGDDSADFDLLRNAARSVIEHLNGIRLLLMFDEYEVLDSFFPDQASAARMQGMLENEPFLLVLFAGPRPLDEVSNRHLLALLDTCKYLPISFLDLEDAERLIREPAEGMLQFSNAAVSKIQQLCGGHPFYIQLLCQSIFTLKGGHGGVDDGDVEAVVKRLIANPPPHLVLTWQDLDSNGKLVAAALAGIVKPDRGATAEDVVKTLREQQYPRIPGKATIQKGLAAMRRADLIRKSEEASPSHVFTMDFVRRWIADSRTVWDLLEERRGDVLSRTAQFWRRLSASAIDLLLPWMPVLVVLNWYKGGYLLLVIVPLYYAVFLSVSDRTVAMRILNLRLVNEDGTQPRWWRSLLFSLFLTMEASSLGLVLVAASTGKLWLWLVVLVLLFIELLHQLQIAVHRQHRGLYDRLSHVLVIYEPSGDK
jgi:uncharacterized RDD family membrane protein YckC